MTFGQGCRDLDRPTPGREARRMRRVYISDLVDRGYFWPQTILMRSWFCESGEEDDDTLLVEELLLSRN